METCQKSGSGHSQTGLIANAPVSRITVRPSMPLRRVRRDGERTQVADEDILARGKLALAISTAVVRALGTTTGRGPTRANTTLGENAVFVVLQDTLTRGESNLVQAGESEAVLDLRRRSQKIMRTSCCREIEQLTGRTVIGFMSDNHIDLDIAVEVFILAPVGDDPAVRAAIAVADSVPK